MLRIWLKDFNHQAVDFPIGDDVELTGLLASWKLDGYLFRQDEGAACAVPFSSWAFCAIVTVGSNTTVPSTPFEFKSKPKPN